MVGKCTKKSKTIKMKFIITIAFALLFSNCAIKVVGYQELNSETINTFHKIGKIIVKNGRDHQLVTIRIDGHDYIAYQPTFTDGWMVHSASCELCAKTVPHVIESYIFPQHLRNVAKQNSIKLK